MESFYIYFSAHKLLTILTSSIFFVNIYGLFDNPMRFRTFSNRTIIYSDIPKFEYYMNYGNVSSPLACISLCKKDVSCMTATFNLTSNVCSFSILPSMHEADIYQRQRFETRPDVNSYAKFRYRGNHLILLFL